MLMWEILGVVFAAGCLGGLIGGLHGPAPDEPARGVQALRLRHRRGKCETWYPTVLGNVLLGGVAAVVFWCLYGPFSGFTIMGQAPTPEPAPRLAMGQLATCLLIGMSGAGFLLTESGRRCAKNWKDDDQS